MTYVLIALVGLLAYWCVIQHITIRILSNKCDLANDTLRRLTGEEL